MILEPLVLSLFIIASDDFFFWHNIIFSSTPSEDAGLRYRWMIVSAASESKGLPRPGFDSGPTIDQCSWMRYFAALVQPDGRVKAGEHCREIS